MAATDEIIEPVRRRRVKSMKRVGPFSKAGQWALMDGRSTEARFARTIREALVEGLAREPTAAEALIISSIAFKALRCSLLAPRVLQQNNGLDHHWLSWSNSMARDLALLGLGPSRVPAPSLAQYLLERMHKPPDDVA
jgi:hypothetical protein